MPQRVLLIGATGRLGRHFVDALKEEKHQVVALVRTGMQGAGADRRLLLDRFASAGVELFQGSLEDEEGLDRACRDVDAVVSCVDHRPDRLRLQENPQSGSNDNQFIVDNFSVDVPEAGTLSLIIVGATFLAIGLGRRIRASRR